MLVATAGMNWAMPCARARQREIRRYRQAHASQSEDGKHPMTHRSSRPSVTGFRRAGARGAKRARRLIRKLRAWVFRLPLARGSHGEQAGPFGVRDEEF